MKALPEPKPITAAKAIRKSIDEIDAWPGEFRIEDVLQRTVAHLGATKTPEHIGEIVRSGLYARIRRRLGVYDRFDDIRMRRYVCYSLKGQRGRNWLKLDNATAKVVTYLLSDRKAFVRDSAAMLPILQAALPILEASGPMSTFADVRPRVLQFVQRAA